MGSSTSAFRHRLGVCCSSKVNLVIISSYCPLAPVTEGCWGMETMLLSEGIKSKCVFQEKL